MKIYLVRHGESEGNVDKALHTSTPDHAIGLTARGHLQARAAGDFFADTLGFGNNFRVWRSPYRRTRETCDSLLNALYTNPKGHGCLPRHGVRESVLLAEQQFGLFDGLTNEQLAEKYPDDLCALHARASIEVVEPDSNCDGSRWYAYDKTKDNGRGLPLVRKCPGCRACC